MHTPPPAPTQMLMLLTRCLICASPEHETRTHAKECILRDGSGSTVLGKHRTACTSPEDARSHPVNLYLSASRGGRRFPFSRTISHRSASRAASELHSAAPGAACSSLHTVATCPAAHESRRTSGKRDASERHVFMSVRPGAATAMPTQLLLFPLVLPDMFGRCSLNGVCWVVMEGPRAEGTSNRNCHSFSQDKKAQDDKTKPFSAAKGRWFPESHGATLISRDLERAYSHPTPLALPTESSKNRIPFPYSEAPSRPRLLPSPAAATSNTTNRAKAGYMTSLFTAERKQRHRLSPLIRAKGSPFEVCDRLFHKGSRWRLKVGAGPTFVRARAARGRRSPRTVSLQTCQRWRLQPQPVDRNERLRRTHSHSHFLLPTELELQGRPRSSRSAGEAIPARAQGTLASTPSRRKSYCSVESRHVIAAFLLSPNKDIHGRLTKHCSLLCSNTGLISGDIRPEVKIARVTTAAEAHSRERQPLHSRNSGAGGVNSRGTFYPRLSGSRSRSGSATARGHL
ncbi:hypothetical protein C7M84_016564 [Penaeus vannamei]|uniref:Uncharacterized protein n=1 Tax=Penaeus vannamei TaxID=6689 RepID=A0A3R7PAU6_PENVA|nr:hypothetical protein C7M84_016564 [Penaeus vannamei]